jgi:hypothetical protein
MRVFKLLSLLFICAVPAAADSVYNVTGVASIFGNNVCGGWPCSEKVTFPFQVEYQLVGVNLYREIVLPASTVKSGLPRVL